jgi:hypothetical protein
MNHQNQLEQMANRAMFATIATFLVIYDNTSKSSINLHKLTKLEPLTLAWMLTIIQTPEQMTNGVMFATHSRLGTHARFVLDYTRNE